MNLRERYAEYIVAWKQRHEREQAASLARATSAEGVAQRCAQLLADGYGVKRVWLFGSLLHHESFHAKSDIDLAVEGLSERKYFEALARMYELAPPGLEIDLVVMESAQFSLKEHILSSGRILYEQA
ncbi:MAG: nucleotidyltransferase domain-containing protein [Chloroflexi bacterium]|nr:nucleotidyltransferase domain-containing protein [Chloroflexota bacterium]